MIAFFTDLTALSILSSLTIHFLTDPKLPLEITLPIEYFSLRTPVFLTTNYEAENLASSKVSA